MEIINEKNEVSKNTNEILLKWQSDFKHLYNLTENADKFDDEFLEECKNLKTHLENNMLDPLFEHNIFLNRDLSIEEIKNCVNKTKNNKATGLDEIPYEVLKYENVIPLLKDFYQFCFDTSLIPNMWRKSIINPIPKDKRKDQRIPLNYRGISLLNTIMKIYSSILNTRFVEYDDIVNIIIDEQNGFRKKRSCIEHIFTLDSIIRNNLNKHKSVFCAFIDFKKAFDSINRDLLFYKLLQNKIDGKYYNAIKQMYLNTEACVRINNIYTDWFETESGVKQGDCLSTTLFNLYINDLIKEIKCLGKGVKFENEKLGVLIYADDLVIITENEEDLNQTLEVVQKFCYKWRILINHEKSQVVHFRNKDIEKSNVDIMIGNDKLLYTNEYKYLGVIFNEYLNFEKNVDKMANSANRALGSIINKFQQIRNMGANTYFKLFNSCVMPVMEYGAEIWGYKVYPKCDQVLYSAIRYFMGVHKFTPIIGLLGDTGLKPTVYSRWIHMIRFWNHLLEIPNSRIVKRIFNHDYKMKKKNWCSQIENIF